MFIEITYLIFIQCEPKVPRTAVYYYVGNRYQPTLISRLGTYLIYVMKYFLPITLFYLVG